MALDAGTKLGPYEILALIGKGGMGEVYRARDTRLGREVAVKISQERFSERFDREARAIAALNHPNICALYDVGPNYLVMEFVEGESPLGPLPIDEALGIAGQIADALAEAHGKGITHRDLKPANVKIKPDGTVKVLDFGLAKVAPAAAGATSEDSPTLTMAATQAGVILGTAAYMSPEQARGKPVDARTDIWAFGVVLYELLTGRKLFKGEDLAETLASVVKEQPDLGAAPPRVRRVLETCLRKDPKKRLQAIGDWRLLLELESTAPSRSRLLGWWGGIAAWVVAGVMTLVAAGLAVVHFRETPPVKNQFRLSIHLPENVAPGFLEISPDGKRVLFSMAQEGKSQLFLRSFDSDELQPLTGTAGARTPFWSPDSRFLAFFAEGKLKVIPATGGPAQVLCDDTGLGRGGTWNRDGVILFASESGPLRRVDSKGGTCTPVEKDPNARSVFPAFLPDGKHFFYVSQPRLDQGSTGVYLATLEEPSGRKILSDRSSVVYTPPAISGGRAHLLFLRENTLMAQPFDDANLQLMGDPFVVVQRASNTLTNPQVAASASADGTLVYVAGRSRESQLVWFDRSGKEIGKAGSRADQDAPTLSPDGSMVTIERRSPEGGVLTWLNDLSRDSESKVAPAEFRGSGNVVWLPDSGRLWLVGVGPEGSGLYEKDLKSGRIRILQKAAEKDPEQGQRKSSDLSRDGRFLIFTRNDPKTRADIWYAPIESGNINLGAAVKILGTGATESQGQLSGDGKWLAYFSDESGNAQVRIRPFPSGERVWTVPATGFPREPRWRGDGKELYFNDASGVDTVSVNAVTVAPDAGGGLHFGMPEKLFSVRGRSVVPQNNIWSYAVRPDGKQFLVNVLTEAGQPTVNVISNWNQGLAGR